MFGLIVGIFITLLGLALFVLGVWDARLAVLSKRWPVTKGEVLSTEVREEKNTINYYYTPIIRYKYRVHGREYTADVRTFDRDSYRDSDRAGMVTQNYPEGKEIEVHYNPNKPTWAVLQPGIKRKWYFVWYFIGTPLVILIGLALAIPSLLDLVGG